MNDAELLALRDRIIAECSGGKNPYGDLWKTALALSQKYYEKRLALSEVEEYWRRGCHTGFISEVLRIQKSDVTEELRRKGYIAPDTDYSYGAEQVNCVLLGISKEVPDELANAVLQTGNHSVITRVSKNVTLSAAEADTIKDLATSGMPEDVIAEESGRSLCDVMRVLNKRFNCTDLKEYMLREFRCNRRLDFIACMFNTGIVDVYEHLVRCGVPIPIGDELFTAVEWNYALESKEGKLYEGILESCELNKLTPTRLKLLTPTFLSNMEMIAISEFVRKYGVGMTSYLCNRTVAQVECSVRAVKNNRKYKDVEKYAV